MHSAHWVSTQPVPRLPCSCCGQERRGREAATTADGRTVWLWQLRPATAAAGSLQSLPPSLLGCLRLEEEELPDSAGGGGDGSHGCGERGGPSDAGGGFDVVFGSYDGGIRQICLRGIIALHISRVALAVRHFSGLLPFLSLTLLYTICCDKLLHFIRLLAL